MTSVSSKLNACVVRPGALAVACLSTLGSPKLLVRLTTTRHVPERSAIAGALAATSVKVAEARGAISSVDPGWLRYVQSLAVVTADQPVGADGHDKMVQKLNGLLI